MGRRTGAGRLGEARRRTPAAAAFFAALAVLVAVLGAATQTGLLTTDEVDYLLVTDNLVERGRFDVRNGIDEVPHPGFLIGNLRLLPVDGEVRLVSQYPPVYAALGAGPYAWLGIRGLFVLNLAGFALGLLAVHALAFRLGGESVAPLAAFCLAALTYASCYAVQLWPHALSLGLVAAATWAAVVAAEGSAGAAVLAGLAAGLAVGVRYPDALPAALLAAWLGWRRPGALPWLALGAAGPALGLLWTQDRAFGDLFATGYGPVALQAGMPSVAGVGLLLAAGLAAAWRARSGRALPRLSPRWAAVAVGALVLAWAVLVPSAPRRAWAEVVDMAAFVGSEPVSGYKKALLQSSPVLALAPAGLLVALRAGGAAASTATLLAALAAVQVAFYATRPFHGGPADAFNMRYLVEVLPPLAALAALAAWDALGRLPRRARWAALALAAAAATALVPAYRSGGLFFQHRWAFTTLPMMLAGTVLAAGAFHVRPGRGASGNGRGATVLAVAAALAAAASGVASWADLTTNLVARGVSARIGAAVESELPEDALLAFYGNRLAVHFAPLVPGRRVRLFDAALSRTSPAPVWAEFANRGIPIVLFDDGREPGWSEAAEQIRQRLPGTAFWVRHATPPRLSAEVVVGQRPVPEWRLGPLAPPKQRR